MSEARFHFLSQEDVVAAGGLDVAATIDVVEEALRLHAEGDTRLPSKSALLARGHGRAARSGDRTPSRPNVG